MKIDKNTESLLETRADTSLFNKMFNEDGSIKTNSDNLENSEESLLEEDDRVAADLIEDVATAVDSEEAAAEQQRIIDEHNQRIMKSPEFKAQVMYENYLRTCGRILDGPTKRRLRKQFLRDAKRGRFDYLFDPEKIAKRQAREQEKFDKLNKPVIHKLEDIDEDTQATLKEMANMEVIKRE